MGIVMIRMTVTGEHEDGLEGIQMGKRSLIVVKEVIT